MIHKLVETTWYKFRKQIYNMGIITLINLLLKNIKVIMVVVMVALFALLLQQCNKAKQMENKFNEATHIADQNLAAMKDSTIQLKMTKEQLATVDSELFKIVDKVDSLQEAKTKQITVVKPQYVPVDMTVLNKLKYDSISKKYGLEFHSWDSVRTIDGVSFFKINKNNDVLDISPDTTLIKNFGFNFTFVISQYEDPKNKFTRTKIVPFYVDSTGKATNPISEKMMKFNFRNAEILDKPWQENKPCPPPVKEKYHAGWGLCITPLAVGVVQQNNGINFKFTPSIGVGYFITFGKK